MFEPSSRYATCEDAILATNGYGGQGSGGQERGGILYKKRRFLPDARKMPLLQEKVIVAGDRLDLIAFQYVGDPEQYWRICDSNNSIMHPLELTNEPGSILRINLFGE
jgi:hypothetical protein